MYPDCVKEVLKASGIGKLFPPQKKALRAGILGERNFLLAMPTASGKTLLSEFAMIKSLREGGRCLYIVPLVALAYEKFQDFRKKYQFAKVGISTGDYDSPAKELASYNLLVLTIEKFDALTRSFPPWLYDVRTLVVDEIHLVGESSRGPRLEGALARFRASCRARIIALSATIGNSEEFASWLDAVPVVSKWRPVPLKEEVLVADDRKLLEYIKDVVEDGGQALVFVNTKKGSYSLARRIASLFPEDTMLGEIAEKVSSDIFQDLPELIKAGVAFHNTWLHPSDRHLIERAFVEHKLKVICCTPTLAMGVSFPARVAIIRNYKFFDGFSSREMPVFWVKQVFGRAGRPEYDEYGIGLLVARNEEQKEELEEKYIGKEPEDIKSQFDDELMEEQILATVVSGIHRRERIHDFFNSTFFSAQGNMMDVDFLLQKLQRDGFLEILKDRIFPTRFGELVSRLYLSPSSALFLRDALSLLKENANDFDLSILVCACKEVPKVSIQKALEISLQLVSQDEILGLCDHSELGSAIVLHAWMNELSYKEMHERFGVYPGEVHSVVSSAEWISYAASRISRFLSSGLERKLAILERRIRYGVLEHHLALASIPGIGRVLSARLYTAGYRKPSDIIRADERELARVFGIGKRRARKLKEEIKHLAYEDLRRRKRREKI